MEEEKNYFTYGNDALNDNRNIILQNYLKNYFIYYGLYDEHVNYIYYSYNLLNNPGIYN